MSTPAKPRQSGIPGPGRSSGIPTPGRSRSSSIVHPNNQITSDELSLAFADAVKANDPSQHRYNLVANSSSAATLSPQSLSLSSGRRSVVGRPSSSASSSSTRVVERARTPTSGQPASRSSDFGNRSAKAFEVGDNVRIESLGFEGILRYIGDIDSKPGLWAGIELSGGFSGKGKNNGSVGGKQYFICPDKCGVFVAYTKLSHPTVGPGAVHRPSSAVSRNGRSSQALGRTTPSSFAVPRTPSASFSSGRGSPSTGRVTPSLTSSRTSSFSSAEDLKQQPLKSNISKTNSAFLSEKITAGSRASMYLTMTAQQLSSRDRVVAVKNTTGKKNEKFGLSVSISRPLSSPTRSSVSPFSTPRPTNARPPNTRGISPSVPSSHNRPSFNTPRPRIPSAVAMPPPPPPNLHLIQSQSPEMLSSSDPNSELSAKTAQRKASPGPFSGSRPNSSASTRSVGGLSLLEHLQSRLEAAEYENERLRASSSIELQTSPPGEPERTEHANEKQLLEEKISELQNNLIMTTMQVEALQTENQRLTLQLVEASNEVHRAVAAQKSKSEAQESEIKFLNEKLETLERSSLQKDVANEAKSLNIKQLTTSIAQSYEDFDAERKDLGVQIDELRIAGQETIALYEERLSEANIQRYELEQRISVLENGIKTFTTDQNSDGPDSRVTPSATQIDNETLRDQVQHLQKKSSKLEEQLEETRATLERDVTNYQDKITRIKLDDEQRKRDLVLKTRQVEQLLKSEASARSRVEEIEEALRESTVALENTRGEVESLRTEIANLDILIDDTSDADISTKLASYTRRILADKAKYEQEIRHLNQSILDSRSEFNLLKKSSSNSAQSAACLQETVETTSAQNASLRKRIAQLEDDLSNNMQSTQERITETDALRKKTNREASFSNGISDSLKISSPKTEPTTEEVAGLKHIIQELQKDNSTFSQQIKLLESENRLLNAEAEQLRQEIRILEENLDDSSLDKEESTVKDYNNASKSPTQLNDHNNIRSESEEQLRKRLNETEIKHARVVHSLNKEISELEALVESKIYREDELEQEVEKLKDRLSRHKKLPKSGTEVTHRLSAASSVTSGGSITVKDEELCEICERPGHDIFNCSLLKEEVRVIGDRDARGLVCEDCESPGHVAADCPHSMDVF